jgi:hypothetical protein
MCTIFLAPGSLNAGAPEARVSDLAWMSGAWGGPFGPQRLEEVWSQPSAGSMVGLIKIIANDATSMIEVALVEEVDDSLELRVRQWAPGFVALADEPLTMKLAEIGPRKVTFHVVGQGALKTLSYSRPTPGEFRVNAVPAEGEAFEIRLAPMTDD